MMTRMADEEENTFRFSSEGDGPIRYTIVNYQRDPDNSTYSWHKVGNYSCKLNNFLLLFYKKNTYSKASTWWSFN